MQKGGMSMSISLSRPPSLSPISPADVLNPSSVEPNTSSTTTTLTALPVTESTTDANTNINTSTTTTLTPPRHHASPPNGDSRPRDIGTWKF